MRNRMKYIALGIASALTCGCTKDEAQPAPLNVAKKAPIEKAQPAAATTTSKATSKATISGRCQPGLVGFSDAPAWLGADTDGWNGTRNPDPKPLAGISNEDMLNVATYGGDRKEDRWHALVSLGRRQAPGAIEAIKGALGTENSIQVREAAVNAMIEHGGPAVLEMFWDLLRDDESPWMRGKAIWGIAAYSPTEAHRAIRFGMENTDKDGEVYGMAILAAASLRDHPEMLMPILEEAAAHEERYAWQEAGAVLLAMPHSEAGNLLERAARETTGNPEKQRSMVWSYRKWLNAFPDLCK